MGNHVGNQLLIILEPLTENFNPTPLNHYPQSFFENKKRKNTPLSLEDNHFKRIKLIPGTFSLEDIDQINNSNLVNSKKQNLIKYKIQLDFYLSNFTFLNNLGFNNIEIDKIIFHKNCYQNLKAIRHFQDPLFKLILPEQIAKLIKFSSATLEVFLTSYQPLLKHQFDLDQIVKIGGKSGGASILKLLGQQISKFSQSGFSVKHMLSLLPAGYKVILYISEHLSELLIEHDTPEEIIKMALETNVFNSNIREKKNLENVTIKGVADSETLNNIRYSDEGTSKINIFDLDETTKLNLTKHDVELDFYLTHFARLQDLGYAGSQIDKIMSHKNYKKNTLAR